MAAFTVAEIPDRIQAKRRGLFTPCETKEQLELWIGLYLGIRLPDITVSDESNSNPMGLIWEIYDRCRRNDLENFEKVMAYASRFSGKTLAASILEVLVVLHMPRNVAHMAAIENQAKKAQAYVKDFFGRPIIRDFVFGDNAREVKVVAWIHKTNGLPLTDREFNKLAVAERDNYNRREQYIKIVICNMAGANGDHVEFMCVDGDTEVLVANPTHTNRKRVRRKISGVFNLVAGLHPSGRRAKNPEPMEVVDPACTVEVLSVNMDTGQTGFQPIVRASRNRKYCIKLVCTDGTELTCTMDHPVYVMGRGFVMGDNIKPGERLVRLDKGKTESARNASSSAAVLEPRPDRIKDAADSWDQVVLGSILGDAGIYKKPSNNPYLQEQHCVKQEAYLSWKRQIINNKIRTVDLSNPRSGYTGAEQVGYRSGCSPLLLPYAGFKTSLVGMERLGPLGLAVWYMDDGCAGNGFRISSESFTKDQNEALVRMLEVNFGIKASVREDHREDSVYYYIGGGIEAKRRLVEVCKEHIHPDMAYKFDLTANVGKCRYCGNNYWFYESPSVGTVRCSNPICHRLGKTMRLCEVKSIEPVGHRTVYDFTLANNHTFFGNGLLQKQCVDELDVIPKQNIKAYDQAKGGIPVGRDGVTAFTLFTSTRKSRVGLVQKEIDNASSTGLVLRHWNTIDVTEPCPPSRHLPNGKPAVYYINDGLVKHIDQAAFDILPDPEKPKWYAEPGYEGCAKCRLFPACKGKLATRQKGVVKSFADGGTALLVSITEIASKFRANTPEFVTTEFLCRKPDTSGLVLPRLAEATHFKSAQQIAALVVGEDTDDGRARGVADKPSLIRFLQQVGARFYTGMDFGFSHIFAVVTIAVWGRYAFVVDAVGQSGLEIEQKIDLVQYLKDWNCTVYGDPEDPSAIKSFKTKGFKMIPWVKGPGTVNGGIEILRTKIYSIGAGPTLFFLEGDPMIAACFKQLAEYSFKVDAKGDFSNVPEDVDDDFCDATRYAVMNVFGKNGSLKGDQTKSSIVAEEAAPPAPQTHGAWIADHVRQLTGESIQEVQQPTQTIKKGGFYWGV